MRSGGNNLSYFLVFLMFVFN